MIRYMLCFKKIMLSHTKYHVVSTFRILLLIYYPYWLKLHKEMWILNILLKGPTISIFVCLSWNKKKIMQLTEWEKSGKESKWSQMTRHHFLLKREKIFFYLFIAFICFQCIVCYLFFLKKTIFLVARLE